MRETLKRMVLVFALLLGAAPREQAQTRQNARPREKAGHSRPAAATPAAKKTSRGGVALLRARLEQCATSPARLRLLAEYGAVFAADASQVVLPPDCFFSDEKEVSRFQRQAGVASATAGGVRVELQPRALRAYLAARDEAKRRGLEITPRGMRASRRSYADTARLWRERIDAALAHWVGRGRLTRREAGRLRSLPPDKQLSQVIDLERRRIYFGRGYGKSILQSVAALGASQHNTMLALDVEQHADPRVRAILARHGWFQTVRNDEPHFTFLGVREAALTSLELRRVAGGGRTFWIPSAAASPASVVAVLGDDGERRPAAARPEERVEESIFATANPGVLIPFEIRKRLRALSRRYWERTGRMLHITSGRRPAERQATAMHVNLSKYGPHYVLAVYRGSGAVREIIAAYEANGRNRRKAIRAMAAVIQSQVERGIVISDHLLGRAVDIRSRQPNGAQLPILREVVKSVGGLVLVEKDHFHVGL